jgi:hypothetical protein
VGWWRRRGGRASDVAFAPMIYDSSKRCASLCFGARNATGRTLGPLGKCPLLPPSPRFCAIRRARRHLRRFFFLARASTDSRGLGLRIKSTEGKAARTLVMDA